ncbi:hypothetical protein QYE76_067150 [Lolium multiflorum]|uniref:Uncharacterized protein n=1 Tax=Lolium multiflorum TaxID=4521 RepID=A0AAD8SC73_LOLMU|nr:hypothetical protein QYE76_067150 [Lolium multiflorum]
MAFSNDDGAANNGFPRRSLHAWEGHLLHQAGYPYPPDTRPPGGGWRLSRGGVPIPPPPRGQLLDVAIEEARMTLTDEESAEPRHHPDNYTAWNSYFLRWGGSSPRRRPPPPPRATAPRATDVGGARGPKTRGRPRASRAATSRCSRCPLHRGHRRAAAGKGSQGAWLPARRLPDRRRGHPWRR